MIAENEILLHHNGQWLHFAKPHQVLSASQLSDVFATLQQVEMLVNANGWHAAGFVSYEAAPAFDSALKTQPASDLPLIWFGLYDAPNLINLPAANETFESIHWQPNISKAAYTQGIQQIKQAIADGRTYQVNYTLRLQTQDLRDPWQAFLRMAQAQQAGHEAYLNLGRWQIASASPELFFKLDHQTITCKPMKGTVKRGRYSAEDQAQADWLRQDEKNRAENVMIVDMIRNDLGHIAKIGSVQVPRLFTPEPYPTLWQMTSTVTAQTSASLAEIFKYLFPCASITGAPKVSTMNIIRQLESAPRQLYTGSIGYIAPNRQASFNVAIRTVLHDTKTKLSEYGAGGGIVWDSTAEDEYEEALLKAQVLSRPPRAAFDLFETMLWSKETGYFLLAKHLKRLSESAAYFGLPFNQSDAEAELTRLSGSFGGLPQRVRLILQADGRLRAESGVHIKTASAITASLAKTAVSSQDIFLFHKTSNRQVYQEAKLNFPSVAEVLLFNERDELTEFTQGNVVLEMNGERFTPPIDSGLLGGVFREHLLEQGLVSERVFKIADLKTAEKVFLINSVRQWQSVALV